ncbi:MAG: phosphate ABC transporter substrate-binding protein [Firmicutes bacterium]|nr:phosphate ABC transporter substrate-binding protein [Bacillota bacterium]
MIQLRKNLFRIAALMLTIACSFAFFSACARSESSVIVAGSTSVQPFAERLAAAYEAETGNSVDIQGGGSSAGLRAVRGNIADIGMSSRLLSAAELEEFNWVKEIAKDGLAVIVHPQNPILKKTGANSLNLSLAQIRGIYSGDITNWAALGGNSADIICVSRESGSGTRSAFEEMVMKEDETQHWITPRIITLNSNGAIRMYVSISPNSIGFISLGLVHISGSAPVSAVAIDGVDASPANVRNDTYRLARSFLFVSKYEPVGYALRFADFVFSDAGQRVLYDEGLVTEKDFASGD